MLNISVYTNLILLFLPINNISISLSTYHNSFHTLYEELNLTSFYVHYTLSLSFFLSFFLILYLSFQHNCHTRFLSLHIFQIMPHRQTIGHTSLIQRPLYTRTDFLPPPISDAFDKREYFFCIIQTIQL